MTLKNQNPKKKGSQGKEDFDFEKYQKEVVAGLIAGKGLLGEEGLLKPLIAKFVESALDVVLLYLGLYQYYSVLAGQTDGLFCYFRQLGPNYPAGRVSGCRNYLETYAVRTRPFLYMIRLVRRSFFLQLMLVVVVGLVGGGDILASHRSCFASSIPSTQRLPAPPWARTLFWYTIIILRERYSSISNMMCTWYVWNDTGIRTVKKRHAHTCHSTLPVRVRNRERTARYVRKYIYMLP